MLKAHVEGSQKAIYHSHLSLFLSLTDTHTHTHAPPTHIQVFQRHSIKDLWYHASFITANSLMAFTRESLRSSAF